MSALARRALRLPPHIAAMKTLRWLARGAQHHASAWRNRLRSSYAEDAAALILPAVTLDAGALRPWQAMLAADAERTLAHIFDLLGSGPVSWDRPQGAEPRLPPGSRNAARRMRNLIGGDYRPLDWHADIVARYRWPADRDGRLIRPGPRPGVDIKRPWEFARLQHLPRLALALLAGTENEARLLREIHNVLLDFRSHNPPGFGVTWVCAMDVAIRAANIFMTAAILRAGGRLAPDVATLVATMLREHGRHIAGHLEWSPLVRGNHYLSDLAGLICCGLAADTPEADAWLAFAVPEFFAEGSSQQLPDGANFEGSTSYHRLVVEILAWTTAMLSGLAESRRARLATMSAEGLPRVPAAPLPATFWPPDWWAMLERAARFTCAVSQPDFSVPQIGDNDDGRFIVLDPTARNVDHRSLIGVIGALLGSKELAGIAGPFCLDATVAAACLPSPASAPAVHPLARAGVAAFRDFGLVIWRRPDFHLTLRCGPVGQRGNGGHGHNDQLSLTLWLADHAIFIDPGTGNYTAWPDTRNRFRSTAMHNTLSVDGLEQNDWEPGRLGLFRLAERSRGRLIEFGPHGAEAEHIGFGPPHRRRLRLHPDAIEGEDHCAAPGRKRLHFHLAPGLDGALDGAAVTLSTARCLVRLTADGGRWRIAPSERSDGYGSVCENRCLVLDMVGDTAAWRLTWELR